MSRAVLLLHVYTPTTPTDASAATTETASAAAAAPQRRGQHDDQASQDERRPVSLKALLTQHLDSEYTVLLVQGWEDAIVREIFKAIPMKGETFEHEYRDLQGKKRSVRLKNEVVILTPSAEAWMQQQVEKARLEIMKNTGQIFVDETPEDELLSLNLDELEQLGDLRKQHITSKNKRKK